MPTIPLASLSDSDLLAETARAACVERSSTAELLMLLSEVDIRKLYLGRGYSSLFIYCTQSLRLSESAAYARITAARASRSFPCLIPLLKTGAVTLTTVSLLVAHLTEENYERLLAAASHKSRREVEQLVASLLSQPDVASSVRRLPVRNAAPSSGPSRLTALLAAPASGTSTVTSRPEPAPVVSASGARRTVIAPLSSERYLLRVTLSADGHEKLERARALLRHQVPDGDLAVIVERALTVLVDQMQRAKHASTPKPRSAPLPSASLSRHVPAAVKREVWARDRGRCAFVGGEGRCTEVGFLEFHHVKPFAAGGPTDETNLQLRCRAHNAYESTLFEQSSATSIPPVAVPWRGISCSGGP